MFFRKQSQSGAVRASGLQSVSRQDTSVLETATREQPSVGIPAPLKLVFGVSIMCASITLVKSARMDKLNKE